MEYEMKNYYQYLGQLLKIPFGWKEKHETNEIQRQQNGVCSTLAPLFFRSKSNPQWTDWSEVK